MQLRPAHPSEADALSALALRSKAHGGYDAAFLERARAELTVPAEACDGVRVVVADRDGELLGFYRIAGDALEDLFVDEPAIGTGVGTALLRHAVATARGLGLTSLLVDADPGAEPFYRHRGAVRVGEAPSGSVPGRLLPQLRLDL